MSETFYCFLVGGQQGSNTFPVDIHPKKTVGDLKKEIIKETRPTLDNIAAHELTLYKVEIENELDNSYTDQDLISHLNQSYQNKNKNKNDGLRVKQQLSEIFPPGKSYYILVQAPKGESIHSRAGWDADGVDARI